MKNEFYKQCLLVNGEATEVAWIPDYLAKTGEWIRVKETGVMWHILEVWMRLNGEAVESNSRDYRTQRDGSDKMGDQMPKRR